MRTRFFIAALAAVALPAVAQAQVSGGSFSLTTPTYLQNFDTLASTGTTGSVLPAGFRINETGGTGGTTYGVNDGSNNAGNSYSYGAAGSTDRALGSLGSGTVTQILFGGVFTNGLGAAITSLAFGYTGEQWRLANSTNDGLTFQFAVGVTEITGMTGWNTVSSLNFAPLFTNGTTGGTALNGNDPLNQRILTGAINGLNIANGSSFGFRWVDTDSGASDQGLAVDNLSISATTAVVAAVPEPSTWALLLVGFGVAGGALRRRLRTVRTAAFA